YLSEEQDAQQTRRLVEEAGRKAVLVPGDIGDDALCRDIIGTAISDLGGIDILVNNAAYQKVYDDIGQIPVDEFEYHFRTNVLAMFQLCKAALPKMPPGSAIINTASVQAYDPSPTLLAYAATKG